MELEATILELVIDRLTRYFEIELEVLHIAI